MRWDAFKKFGVGFGLRELTRVQLWSATGYTISVCNHLTRLTQLCITSASLSRVRAWLGWRKWGYATSDPVWHVTFRSSVVCCKFPLAAFFTGF